MASQITGRPTKNSLQFQRWLRHKCGATVEEIAKTDGVDVKYVRQAIDAAEVYHRTHSLEMVNTSVGGAIQAVMPEVTKTLKRGLTSKKRRKAANGRMITEHDMTIQLKTVGEVRGLVESIQPKGNKGGDVNVNTTNQTAIGVRAFSEDTYQPGVEERIDAIRSRVTQQNLLPREVGTPDDPDAEIEETEEPTAVVPVASSEDAPETTASDV